MLIHVAVYLACVVSPLLGFAEPLVVLLSISGKLSVFSIATLVAAGQCTAFAAFHAFGDQLLAYFPRIRAALDKHQLGHAVKDGRKRWVVILLAGVFGMPPATIVAAAGPMVDPVRTRLVALLFLGRVLRFAVIALVPGAFSSIIRTDAELIPLWVRNLA
jgi:membrane protein YqaA with SNARE-associated domain